MKKYFIKGLVIAGLSVAAILTVSLTSVSAQSVYDEYSNETAVKVTDQVTYTVEEMLNYAINNEFMAQAEYQVILEEFKEVIPFSKIVLAKQTHIDTLLPLFETYNYAIPENNASESIVIPDSITSAIATGLETEKANIEMYQIFLNQNNLPEDVRNTFEYLMNASMQHLNAFSHDLYSYYGSDMMNQVKNQFRKMLGDQSGEGFKSQNQSHGSLGQRRNGTNARTGDQYSLINENCNR